MGKMLAIGVVLAALSAGCSTPGYVGYTKLEPGTPYWVAYDSNRRGGLILVDQRSVEGVEKSFILSCSEPPPDSAGTSETSAKGGAAAPAAGAKARLEIKNENGVVMLAHRSEDVEMLRESYYRLCELSLRQGWTPKDLNEKYGQVLGVYRQVVASRAAAECFKAQAALAVSKPDAAAALHCASVGSEPAPPNPLAPTAAESK